MENRTSHEQKHHGGNFVLTFDTLDLSKMQYPVQQRCNWNAFFFYRWIDANAVRFAVCVIESEKKWSWTETFTKMPCQKMPICSLWLLDHIFDRLVSTFPNYCMRIYICDWNRTGTTMSYFSRAHVVCLRRWIPVAFYYIHFGMFRRNHPFSTVSPCKCSGIV